MEAVNSRPLILPFCMDAIVHKHAVTLRQLPGNIFDVGQAGSLEHYGSPSRVLRKVHFWPHYPITPIASVRLHVAQPHSRYMQRDVFRQHSAEILLLY
jgi:hypothetical protein